MRLAFYAASDDGPWLVSAVLRLKGLQVFALSSRPRRRLRPLTTPTSSSALALWSMASRASPPIRRVIAPDGRWHEVIEGAGLISLVLQGPSGRSLSPSSLESLSVAQARRRGWADLESWDFDAVTQAMERVTSLVRRRSVGALGSRLVLPGAAALFEVGLEWSST